nr:hypothetical protein CFP56_01228 [Quercus suber]
MQDSSFDEWVWQLETAQGFEMTRVFATRNGVEKGVVDDHEGVQSGPFSMSGLPRSFHPEPPGHNLKTARPLAAPHATRGRREISYVQYPGSADDRDVDARWW